MMEENAMVLKFFMLMVRLLVYSRTDTGYNTLMTDDSGRQQKQEAEIQDHCEMALFRMGVLRVNKKKGCFWRGPGIGSPVAAAFEPEDTIAGKAAEAMAKQISKSS